MTLSRIAGLVLIALAVGCQAVAGFEDFGAAKASAGTGGSAATGGTSGTGGGGTAGSGGGTSVGSPCATEADCPGDVCVIGFCRPVCDDDSDCNDGQLCIEDGGRSGCRLSGELSCTDVDQPCPSSTGLECALDKSCRRPCTGASDCVLLDQECIAGTCVGRNEPNSTVPWFDCPTGRSCGGDGGKQIISCNETTPGPTVLATCESAALCEGGKNGGQCAPKVCTAGTTQCVSATAQECRIDGSGFDDLFGPCASQQLCLNSLGQTGATQCLPPACSVGETRCRSAAVETCAADLTKFDKAPCTGSALHCDPGAGACFQLGIDAHEVTRAEYAVFLGASKPAQPTGCSWNTVYDADTSCMALQGVCSASCNDHPQVCVDWCDAWSYCEAQGKRLCGRIGGGILASAQFGDPARSEWMNACTSGGEFAFPYGNTQINASCKGKIFPPNTTRAVGSLDTCKSSVPSYAAAFDLSGNAAEWDDACAKPVADGTAGPSDACHVRGGSYLSENQDLACAADRTLLRNQVSPEVGFRCCGP